MTISQKQRAMRKQTLGASDIGVLFGVDPWRTPHDLWSSKVYDLLEETSEAAELGNDAEPMLLDWAERRLGVPVRHRNQDARASEGVPISCHVDGLSEWNGQLCVVEAKVTSQSWEWGAEGTDQVPYRVTLQVQTQMHLWDAASAVVVVLLPSMGRLERRIYHVMRDDRIISKVLSLAVTWWDKYIVQGNEPPDQPTLSVVQRVVREEGVDEEPVLLDATLVEAREEASRGLALAKKAKDDADARLLAALGDRRFGVSEAGHVVTYKQQTRKEYVAKESTFSVLRVKASKKEG